MGKFKLNREGIRSLLRSPGMAQILESRAKNIQNRCGDGYGVNVYTGRNRVNVSVQAKNKKATKDNVKNNTLLKAVR